MYMMTSYVLKLVDSPRAQKSNTERNVFLERKIINYTLRTIIRQKPPMLCLKESLPLRRNYTTRGNE